MNIIKELFQRRKLVSEIYKSGIGEAYILLRVILPIVLLFILLIIFYFSFYASSIKVCLNIFIPCARLN